MKCPNCQGRKYIELDKVGLLVAGCPECKGTGQIEEIENDEPGETFVEVAAEANAFANALMPKLEGEIPQTEDEGIYTGLLFQIAGERTDEYGLLELWKMAKEASLEKMEFPHLVVMPCGKTKRFNSPSSILNLIPVNLMCACGNPNHYIVRFVDNREGEDVSINRDRPDNQPTGSGDTSKPKRTRKPKARKKATKRTG